MVVIVDFDKTFGSNNFISNHKMIKWLKGHNRKGDIVFIQTKGNIRKVAAIKRWLEANGVDYNAVGDGFIRE